MNWIPELWQSVSWAGKFSMAMYGVAFTFGVLLLVRYSLAAISEFYDRHASTSTLNALGTFITWLLMVAVGVIFWWGMAEIVGLV